MTESVNAKELYNRAVACWGPTPQMLMLVEECAELQQSVLHLMRGRTGKETLAEELADVRIMIELVEHVLDIEKLVQDNRETKLNRLLFRVKKSERSTLGEVVP